MAAPERQDAFLACRRKSTSKAHPAAAPQPEAAAAPQPEAAAAPQPKAAAAALPKAAVGAQAAQGAASD